MLPLPGVTELVKGEAALEPLPRQAPKPSSVVPGSITCSFSFTLLRPVYPIGAVPSHMDAVCAG